MPRVLLLATTTGYQTRAFGEAAARLGVELVFATDRCHLIEDPWQDQAIPIRFHDEDASVAAILASAAVRPLDGLLVVGDRPTVIGARVAEQLGLAWHPPEAATVARHKQLTRERLRDAGLPVPWFFSVAIDDEGADQSVRLGPTSGSAPTYPCVVKPVALSGSRGVMRADNPEALAAAFERLRALMHQPDVRAERNEAHATAIVEAFIPGREFAVEGLMNRGVLRVLAIFDKPDPLDGPFFEETIYLTPSTASEESEASIVSGVQRAAQALGLWHGPVHAECRVNKDGVFVLEVAARPIGGLCARALRFQSVGNPLLFMSLEDVLMRHALGERVVGDREASASGVMMIPIPKRGVLRRVDGVDEARAVDGVDEIHITAKPDQLLVPLPEGASYLGFIFARGGHTAQVEQALRDAHARLSFTIEPELPVLTPGQIHYNLLHG